MPRCARLKDKDAVYHVMVKSITEIPLFKKDDDKNEYLNLMKKYQTIYGFKVYAYCIMTNHAHFIIDPMGADISKIMHGLNFKYAQTFNKNHERHGHLFQDRFKSKIVGTGEYLLTLSAYIHNNPLKINGYEKCPEKYKYSSLKVYLGLEKDDTGLLDEGFIMQMFDQNVKKAREDYLKFVYICDDDRIKKEEVEFEDEKTEYKSERKIIVRDFDPKDIAKFIAEETGVNEVMLHIKNSRNTKVARALAALLMRSLCNYRCSDICKFFGNITQSRVSKLCCIGVDIISKDERYRDIINKFIIEHAAAA